MVRVNTTESNPEGGSGGRIDPGEYHMVIDEASEHSSDYGSSLKIVASVLAGTTPGQAGKKQTEFFNLTGKSVDRLRRLLVATGMMTDEQWVARIGQPLDFDESLLKGRQFCARIKMKAYQGSKEENKGKSFPDIGFDIWGVFESKSQNVPKDPDMIALLAPPAGQQVAATAGGNGGAVAATATSQPMASGGESGGFNW